jgi:hypothetical protein
MVWRSRDGYSMTSQVSVLTTSVEEDTDISQSRQ